MLGFCIGGGSAWSSQFAQARRGWGRQHCGKVWLNELFRYSIVADWPLFEIDICLFAKDIGISATNTLDFSQCVHDFTLAINVSVEKTKNVLDKAMINTRVQEYRVAWDPLGTVFPVQELQATYWVVGETQGNLAVVRHHPKTCDPSILFIVPAWIETWQPYPNCHRGTNTE